MYQFVDQPSPSSPIKRRSVERISVKFNNVKLLTPPSTTYILFINSRNELKIFI